VHVSRQHAGDAALEADAGTVAILKMAIYNNKMDISVTEFKQRCLEIIRQVEESGKAVAITRRGKVVARLQPPGRALAGT